MIGPPTHWRFYVDYVSDGILVGSMRYWAGLLGESGEYRMGRVRVVCYDIRSSEGCSPHLCQLRNVSVGSCCIKHWLCTGTYGTYVGPINLVAFTVTELDDNLPRFMEVQWDTVRATHGLPVKIFAWKMALGWGRTWPNSLIVIMKGGHSCSIVLFILGTVLFSSQEKPARAWGF
jgi:hypothetical protein